MAVLLVVSTAFLALCAAVRSQASSSMDATDVLAVQVAYQYISQLVANGGTLAFRPTIAATVQPFLLTVVRLLIAPLTCAQADEVFSVVLGGSGGLLGVSSSPGRAKLVLSGARSGIVDSFARGILRPLLDRLTHADG